VNPLPVELVDPVDWDPVDVVNLPWRSKKKWIKGENGCAG